MIIRLKFKSSPCRGQSYADAFLVNTLTFQKAIMRYDDQLSYEHNLTNNETCGALRLLL